MIKYCGVYTLFYCCSGIIAVATSTLLIQRMQLIYQCSTHVLEQLTDRDRHVGFILYFFRCCMHIVLVIGVNLYTKWETRAHTLSFHSRYPPSFSHFHPSPEAGAGDVTPGKFFGFYMHCMRVLEHF